MRESAVGGGVSRTRRGRPSRLRAKCNLPFILALERGFAALARALLLGEAQTAIVALGCALILAGAEASEIGPLFARKAASGAT